jgi:hypothetical protein
MPEPAPGLNVHGGRGFVEDEQAGISDQRHREAEPLRLTAGEAVDAAFLEPVQLRDIDRLVECERCSVEAAHHPEQLTEAHAGHHAAVLEHRSHAGVRRRRPRRGAEHRDAAGVRGREAEEHGDRRGLAGAVRAQQRDRLPTFHGEAEVVDSEHGPEAPGDAVDKHSALGGGLRRRERGSAGGRCGRLICHALSLRRAASPR